MSSWLKILGEALNEIFQFEGRMSAKKFSDVFTKWFRILVCVLAPSLDWVYFFNQSSRLTDFSLLLVVFNLLFIFYMGVGLTGMVIRRLHDMSLTGFEILIPVIAGYYTDAFIVWFLCYFFLSNWSGTDGKNRYGEKPIDY